MLYDKPLTCACTQCTCSLVVRSVLNVDAMHLLCVPRGSVYTTNKSLSVNAVITCVYMYIWSIVMYSLHALMYF